jgi:acyl-CoA hydrolase
MNKSRTPAFSKIRKTEVVCPNDTNPMGILQGGVLVQWMDIAAAVCAQTHAGRICVTASIDTVSFNNPARIGDIITMDAKLTRTFTSSMEIMVTAWSRAVSSPKKKLISESYFTFVCLDDNGNPAVVIPVKPVSAAERKEYEAALKRKKKK